MRRALHLPGQNYNSKRKKKLLRPKFKIKAFGNSCIFSRLSPLIMYLSKNPNKHLYKYLQF